MEEKKEEREEKKEEVEEKKEEREEGALWSGEVRPSIGGNESEEWNQVSAHSSSSSNHHRTQNFHHQH